MLLLAKNNHCQWEDWFKPFWAVRESKREKAPAHGMECTGRPEDGEFGMRDDAEWNFGLKTQQTGLCRHLSSVKH